LLCNDFSSELADISVGDAWLPELMKIDQFGTSLIISRTKIGTSLLERAYQENRIKLKEVDPLTIKRSHKPSLIFKKRNLRARIRIAKNFVHKNEIFLKSLYSLSPKSPKFIGYLGGYLAFVNSFWSKKRVFVILLSKLPKRVLRLYGLMTHLMNKMIY